MMSEAVVVMSGLSVENETAQVALTVGSSTAYMSTHFAKNIARQLLLCVDDAEEYNKTKEVEDAPLEQSVAEIEVVRSKLTNEIVSYGISRLFLNAPAGKYLVFKE
jgi:hypothetical protein